MPNDDVKLLAVDKLHDGKAAHGNNKSRSQNFELGIHPTGTVANFIGCGDTIAAARRLAGKTADDSGKIDLRAHCEFIEPAKFLEPAKQGLTSGMSERSFQSRFADSGSLSDHHNLAVYGAA